MIPPEEISLYTLTRLLDDAVIDWTKHDDSSVYLTSMSVPLWLCYEDEKSRLTARTYWPVRPEASDLDVLAFANSCNASLVAVQFWYNAELRRFFGRQVLSCEDGLNRRAFIHTIRQFAEVFGLAVREKDQEDILCEYASDGLETPAERQ